MDDKVEPLVIGAAINQRAQIKRPPIYWVVLAQIGSTFLLAIGLLIHSKVAALSALLGGVVCFIPNSYFAYKAFQYTGAKAVSNVTRSFFLGVTWKLVLTALLFGIVFAKIKPLNHYALFGSFFVAQVVGIFVTARVTTKQPKR